ncbi:MAG: hypothetical protein DCC75_08425 [Proteobacteria bacterium]|nr:MAG: hypothetical protein DCC75_08425 [Pseudomonadota bacterium]
MLTKLTSFIWMNIITAVALLILSIAAITTPSWAQQTIHVDGHSNKGCHKAMLDAYEDAFDECPSGMFEICSQSQNNSNTGVGFGGFGVNVTMCTVDMEIICLDQDSPFQCQPQEVEFEY